MEFFPLEYKYLPTCNVLVKNNLDYSKLLAKVQMKVKFVKKKNKLWNGNILFITNVFLCSLFSIYHILYIVCIYILYLIIFQ